MASYSEVSGDKSTLQTNSTLSLPLIANRYLFVVQDYCRVREDGESWFFTYNHDVDHEYFAERTGFVRTRTRYQGLVGVPSSTSFEKKTTVTWLMNLDFGGLVPGAFLRHILANLMYFPRGKVREMQIGMMFQTRDLTPANGENKDTFVADTTEKLDIEDCLIAEFKNKTIEEQREYFQTKMKEMATEEGNDSWVLKGMTNAKGIADEDQINVWERDVPWSSVKQLRSTVETEFSCDEVFENLCAKHGQRHIHYARRARTVEAEKVLMGDEHFPIKIIEEDGLTCLMVKTFPLPCKCHVEGRLHKQGVAH